MNNKRTLLLRTMLLSTSGRNILKHSTDKHQKNQIIANTVGMGIVYLMIIGYSAAVAIGMGALGMKDSIPSMCAFLITFISFLFTLLKSNGYLFEFNEYDMLMAMPFSVRTIVDGRFLYMYLKSLPILFGVSFAALIGYCVGGGFHVWTIFAWLFLTLLLPMLPTVIASAIGVFIARIGAGFRHKKLIQIILLFIVILPCFFLQFIMEKIFQDNQVETILNQMGGAFTQTERFIPTISWFCKGVVFSASGVLSFLLLSIVSVSILELFLLVVAKYYRQIHSGLTASSAHKTYKMQKQKVRSIAWSIAFKEFKSFTGSTTYVVNAGIGVIMTVLIGVIALFVKMETLIAVMLKGAPVPSEALLPAIPFLLYFLLGMVPTTCISPSFEGKHVWIIRSLPIDPMDDCRGKMLFHLCLTVPFGIFGTICLAVSARAGFLITLLCMILEVMLCTFSTIFGMICGLKFINLHWQNEIEVIKQGKAVALYLLPNMLLTLALCFGTVVLGIVTSISTEVILLVAIVFFTLLSYLLYLVVRRMAKSKSVCC